MATITATDTSSQPIANATIAVFTDGTWVALSEQSGTIHYHTSPDAATWTDRGALPGSSFTLAHCFHLETVSVGGTPELHLWLTQAVTGQPLLFRRIPWSGGSLGSATDHVPSNAPLNQQDGSTAIAAAWYDAGNSVYHVVSYGSGFPLVTSVDVATGTSKAFLILSFYQTGETALDIGAAGGTVFVTLADTYRGAIILDPLVYTASPAAYAGNNAAIETAAGGTTGTHHLVTDNDGKQTIVYQNGTSVFAVRRTGTNTYATPQLLGALDPLHAEIAVAHDTGSDDCWVLYPTASTESNGEIMASRRRGGIWQTSTLIAGGDASGYQWPKLTLAAVSTAFGAAWLKGTSTTRELDFTLLAGSSAPGKPTNLTNGSVAGLDPTLHADYLNTSPNDLQQSAQRQMWDATATTLILDTGQVATTSPDWIYPGSPALVYDTDYQWRDRYWDALSASGAGTASTWSDFATITPRRAGTVTGVDVQNAGVVSTTTITGTSIAADFTWTQGDGHNADAYQLILTRSDGVTPICQTSLITLSPVLASAASFTTGAFALTGINTGDSVCLVVVVRDALSGLLNRSTPLPLTVTFSPPPAPTGFTATPNDLIGVVALAWTNPVEAVTAETQFKRSTDTDWSEDTSGTLIDSSDVPANTTLSYDYRVRITDDRGVPSAWVTITGVVLDMQAGKFGVWLIDLDADLRAAIGAADDLSVFELDTADDEKGFVPMTRSVWVSSFGPTEYDEGTQFKVFLPSATPDGDGGTINGTTVMTTLKAMRHHRLLYTEPTGRRMYCRLTAFKTYPMSGGHWYAMFTLRQTDAPADAIL